MKKACETKLLAGKEYRCFFELTLLVIGGKWKPIILYHLARMDVARYGELRRSMHGITERMLTKQLRELEADGLVNRQVYRQVPPKVEYSLTEMGESLIPILESMRDWGYEYEQFLGGEGLFDSDGYESAPDPKGVRIRPAEKEKTNIVKQ